MLNLTICEECNEMAKEEVNYPTDDIRYESNCHNCGHLVTIFD
ncbi:hypothetical protein ABFV99_13835 [Cytobacillus horneckiae]